MRIQESYQNIFEENREWVEKMNRENPDFFAHPVKRGIIRNKVNK
jgi:carbonic anhydrase